MRHSECIHGHLIRGPADRLSNGVCRRCDLDSQAKYKARRRSAMALFKLLEARGLPTDIDDEKADRLATALEIIDACDAEILAAVRQLDPAKFARALATVAAARQRVSP